MFLELHFASCCLEMFSNHKFHDLCLHLSSGLLGNCSLEVFFN